MFDDIEITDTSPWHRQYWAPWGYNIHFHDVQYLHLCGTLRKVTKHFYKGGAFKHYCFEPRRGPMIFTRNYAEIVEAVKACVARERQPANAA